MNCNKSKKSICFITDAIIMGGVEKVLIDSLKYIYHKSQYAENELEIYVYVLHYVNEKIAEMIPPNVKVVECNLPNNSIKTLLMNMPYISRFFYKKIFNGKKFDCVISLKPEYLCVAYSPLFRKKVHWYHADTYLKYSDCTNITFFDRMKKLILKLGLKKNDMVWTVSPTIAENMQETFSLHNVHALPNPISCSDIIEKSQQPCDVVFDKNAFNVVCIGRLSPEKGFDRMINAFSDGRLIESNVHVYFIGGGLQESKYKAMVEQNNWNDNIHFLGIQTNPYPYLKQASVLVCPSRDESFGLTMFEAMTLGVPVISTATFGGRYVTQNGTVACMIDNSDTSKELAERILSLVSSCSNYNYSLEKAKEWALKHDVSLFGERFVSLLNDILYM